MLRVMKYTAVAAAMSFSLSSLAASSANLLLRGTVGPVNQISISPNGANNTSLDIINGEFNKHVADATEVSNSPTGYKIMLSSINGGLLVNTSAASQSTAYTVNYDGAPGVTPTATPTAIKNVASLATTTVHISAINVDVTAYPAALAGDYEDTVTLSIVAN